MQTVHIYRLKCLDRRTRARLRAVQQEAARVWMYCLERHHAARVERTYFKTCLESLKMRMLPYKERKYF